MKKIASVFLLLIIGLTIIGFFPIFKFFQYRIRQEIKMTIKQGVPEEKLHVISFLENAKIAWVRKGQEFRYNNQMFDIVKQKTVKGRVIYWCINDKEEAQLFGNLDDLVKKQMDNENSPFGNAAEIMIKIFSQCYSSEKSCVLLFITKGQEIYFHYPLIAYSVYMNTEIPPPKLV